MPTIFDNPQLCILPPGEGTDPVVPSDVAPPHVSGPPVARGDGVQESEADANTLGRQLLEAIKQVMSMRAAWEEPVMVTPERAVRDVLPAPPFDIEAALVAVEGATTEEEVITAIQTFLAGAETMFTAGTDPLAGLTTVFGPECVAAVTEVCAAAVVDLEAEAAVTVGPITERAGRRIARSMVHRLTMRGGRTLASAPRVHPAFRGRVMRAPRSRRVHRRAVRLSAVASAGDGPPSPEPPATTGPRNRAQCARTNNGLLIVAQVDHVPERIMALRERELTNPAAGEGQRVESVGPSDGPQWREIETPHEMLRTLEVRR